jgi:hypothetical protein
MCYKRNQVEEAIAQVVGSHSAKRSLEVGMKLKRLLQTDRSLGRNAGSADPAQAAYAFYGRAPPGKGADVWFSEHDVFALLIGLRLLGHGWPQGFAVEALRRVRPQLEREHARILQLDPAALFDARLTAQRARPGDLAFGSADPVFLTLVSVNTQSKDPPLCAICRGHVEAMKFVKQQEAQSCTLFELTQAAHALSIELSRAKPRKRGRSR